jgi:hypothetical protein
MKERRADSGAPAKSAAWKEMRVEGVTICQRAQAQPRCQRIRLSFAGLTACGGTFGMSVKLIAGIGSAPPPPCAFAAAALNKIASRAAAHIFNIFRSSLPRSTPDDGRGFGQDHS